MTILDTIIDRNRSALIEQQSLISLSEQKRRAAAAAPCRDFAAALAVADRVNVIAELKKASPSKGVIREDFDVIKLSSALEQGGAAALSILTEQFFFQGALDYLKQVRNNVSIPLLRKDFIFDPYQVYEARGGGADAILLIAAALEAETLTDLYHLARDLGLQVLVEVHNQAELDMVLDVDVDIIGINCRDLKTFVTDLAITEKLLGEIPDGKIKVAESGIKNSHDINHLIGKGANAFLIGETIMGAASPGEALRRLLTL